MFNIDHYNMYIIVSNYNVLTYRKTFLFFIITDSVTSLQQHKIRFITEIGGYIL